MFKANPQEVISCLTQAGEQNYAKMAQLKCILHLILAYLYTSCHILT